MDQEMKRNETCIPDGRKEYGLNDQRNRLIPVDVLYIHPAKQGENFTHVPNHMSRSYDLIPVGIIGLLNLLKDNGITVKGLNYPLEIEQNERFNLREWLRDQSGIRIIMLDLHWYEHSYGTISIVRTCKEVLPGVWTVIGGLTASAYSREILEHFPEVDFIIRGDAEKPLLNLVQLLMTRSKNTQGCLGLAGIPNLSYRHGNSIVDNKLTYIATSADLDCLDFVNIDFLEHHQQYSSRQFINCVQYLETFPLLGHWLAIARGCHYDCAFCGGGRIAHKMLAGRKNVDVRSVPKVVDDIRRLKEKGIKQVSFTFDIAELGEGYWRELFSSMVKSNVKIGLYNEFFKLPKDEFILEFVKTVTVPFSCLVLSPLSGSEKVRRLNGKPYSNEEFLHTLKLLKVNCIPVFVYFSLNLPGEHEETFEETLNLAKQIYDCYPSHLLKILITYHTIEPYSPMSTQPKRYSIEVNISNFMNYYEYCRSTRHAGRSARAGMHRGFKTVGLETSSWEIMADKWDALRKGRESNWFPVPSTW